MYKAQSVYVMPHGSKQSSRQMAEQYKVSFSQESRLLLSQVTLPSVMLASASKSIIFTSYSPNH